MHLTRPRLTPLTVLVAVAALLFAAGGGAVAGSLITGKKIKNGSIASVDVKNKSLKARDIRNASLTGVDIKSGSVGAGDLAPSARNEVQTASAFDTELPTCTEFTTLDSCSSLVSVDLGPGTWLVSGTLVVDNLHVTTTGLANRCALWRDGSVLAESRFMLNANQQPGEVESVVMQEVIVATDGTLPVSLRCTEGPIEQIKALSPTLTAVKVS